MMEHSAGTLSCTILDRRSSIPLSGARISCVWRTQRISTLRLDTSGSFKTDLPEGVYDIIISAHGFLSVSIRGIGILAGHQLQLQRALVPGEGQMSEGEPATAVGGFVLDRLHRPLANISIHAVGGKTRYTTQTDRRGAYLLHGVAPAMYDLEFRRGNLLVGREPTPIPDVRNFIRVDTRLLSL